MNSLEFLARRLCGAVAAGSDDASHTADELFAFLEEQNDLRSDHEGTIGAAQSNYSNEDCQIHDQPMIDSAEGGVWVEAWVWVPTEEEP